jgi:NAD(P)-dependent dehydrogenase (short-subunit alcohol dehydrogenase family)
MSDGRVVMISGAGRGIGAAIASALAQRGWGLSLGVRTPERVADRAEALVHRYDAREPGSERAWVAATVARFGRIDAVVNNAGIMIPKSVVEADDAELDAVLDINVKAPLRLVRAAWPHLAASGRGRVVTVVSLSGKRVKSAGSGLYAMSKFAALGLAHAIRHAGWEKGVRSTAICPGLVATDMARSVTDLPPEAMTQPEDLARIVALILELPNTASVAEIPINALLDDSY